MKAWKWSGNVLMTIGIALLLWFGYSQYQQDSLQQHAMDEARILIEEDMVMNQHESDVKTDLEAVTKTHEQVRDSFEAFVIPEQQAFAILEIGALDRSVPVVDGTSADDLEKGVGHVKQTSLPGGGEQIVLSGHRDTVFRDFGELKHGDVFLVHMPYGTFQYEIQATDIVDENDRTVIREMGEEVLVVTTCYPFHYVNNAPERFVIYAYPL